MERSRVSELHFITPIANLPSIMERGILSNRRAGGISHESVAHSEVQDRRSRIRVPSGQWLHEYANLYFDARNPMMYKRLAHKDDLAVVCVGPAVLDQPGAVIADGNAASTGTSFHPSPQGLAVLDSRYVYAAYWTDPDWRVQAEKKRRRCAEVLVPDAVPPAFLLRADVCRAHVLRKCHDLVPSLTTAVNGHVFFS
jgi:hypothetical protein